MALATCILGRPGPLVLVQGSQRRPLVCEFSWDDEALTEIMISDAQEASVFGGTGPIRTATTLRFKQIEADAFFSL